MSTPEPVRKKRPSSEAETRRARIIVVIAVIGIAATLIAYAVSPGIQHAVNHVFDHDKDQTHTTTVTVPAVTTPTTTVAPSGKSPASGGTNAPPAANGSSATGGANAPSTSTTSTGSSTGGANAP